MLLTLAMPLAIEQAPPPVAKAGCQGVAATSYVAAAGCMGTVARRAPLRTVAANHRNRVASRQAARADRVRVAVYRPALVAPLRAPAVAVVTPRVRVIVR